MGVPALTASDTLHGMRTRCVARALSYGSFALLTSHYNSETLQGGRIGQLTRL